MSGKRRMRIVIDARILRLSTGRYVERLLHYLQEIDQENEYIVLLLKKDFDGWVPRAPNFTKVVADYPIYSIAEQVQLAGLLRSLKADLVHFTMPQQPVLYRGLRVTTIHDLTLLDFVNQRKLSPIKAFYKNRVKPAVFKIVLKRFARGSAQVIAPTKYVKTQLVGRLGLPPSRVSVTYEAADKIDAAPVPYVPMEGKKFILAVGNAYPHKNLGRLIEAFRKFKRPDLHLVLAGKKDFFYEELERQARADGVQNVHFTGFVSDAELRWLYEHARLYVFPSLSEGFGLPGLEAMRHGTPVVSSNATCLPEVYDEAAHYFEPTRPAHIAAAIAEVLDTPPLRQQLIEAGTQRAGEFSWRRMAEQTLEVYREALKRG